MFFIFLRYHKSLLRKVNTCSFYKYTLLFCIMHYAQKNTS